MMYRSILRPLLFRLEPETAHHLAAGLLTNPLTRPFLALGSSLATFRSSRLETELCGIPLANPVGLAAGFDKNATMFPYLHRLGFGFVEIGTVTRHAQPGNPRPRLFRLPADQALINRMGFNNDGADTVAPRVAARRARIPLGGNIGKSKITPLEDAVEDYAYTYQAMAAHVDYFVVNVSSPNTPNLRKLQEKEPLLALLRHLRGLDQRGLPLLLKIAPDLTEGQLEDIVEVVTESGIDGVIATNTTIARSGLQTPAERIEAIGAGGLSGPPVRAMANRVIAFLRRNLPDEIPIVGVGGVFDGRDAFEKITLGATCVQIYTGFVYGGQNTVHRINRELDRILEAEGFAHIREAVGAAL